MPTHSNTSSCSSEENPLPEDQEDSLSTADDNNNKQEQENSPKKKRKPKEVRIVSHLKNEHFERINSKRIKGLLKSNQKQFANKVKKGLLTFIVTRKQCNFIDDQEERILCQSSLRHYFKTIVEQTFEDRNEPSLSSKEETEVLEIGLIYVNKITCSEVNNVARMVKVQKYVDNKMPERPDRTFAKSANGKFTVGDFFVDATSHYKQAVKDELMKKARNHKQKSKNPVDNVEPINLMSD